MAVSKNARIGRAARVPPELLAPAGGWPELRAAVQAGADAVYLGVKTLNARRGAANFDAAELDEVVRYAHLRQTRVYLTLNVLVLEDELAQAVGLADEAAAAGVDALVIQDLGLATLLARRYESWRLHASTQIGAHDAGTVRRLAELGFARVTLARELSLQEVGSMAATGAEAGIEVESFVHGALCYSYSGQCLMSSFVGGRSANRGLCPQACRLAYDVVGRTGQALRQKGAYPLSTRDLCGLPVLEDLVATGVAALKIEGRMRSPAYVASAVDVYRKALDGLGQGREAPRGAALARSEDYLADAFNRGFTPGHLTGERGEGLMSYGRPSNRGLFVGRLATDATPEALTIRPSREVEPGDTVQVWTSSAGGNARGPGTAEVKTVERGSDADEVRLLTSEPLAGRAGDRVMRVRRARLVERARSLSRAGANERTVPIRVTVRARLGEEIEVRAVAPEAAVEVRGPVLDAARTTALKREQLEAHLGRLGNTVYRVFEWEVDLDPRVGIRFGELHHLKDALASGLDEARLTARRPPVALRDESGHDRPQALDVRGVASGASAEGGPPPAGARLHVVVMDEGQARAALDAGATLVSVPAHVVERFGPDQAVGVALPVVIHDPEASTMAEGLATPGRPVLVGNLGLVGVGGRECTTDWRFGVTNTATAQVLAERGASMVGLSPELSLEQTLALGRRLGEGAARLEVLVHGQVEVMTSRQCPGQVVTDCDRVCARCPRRLGWALRDAKGFLFPFVTDDDGLTHIFNAHELCLASIVGDLVSCGFGSLRLDLALSDADDVGEVVAGYRTLIDIAVRDPSKSKVAGEKWRDRRRRDRQLTTGHAFRPVA